MMLSTARRPGVHAFDLLVINPFLGWSLTGWAAALAAATRMKTAPT
jgi:hypothetical protein